MIGTPEEIAAETKPPRPKRCSLYRSLNGLPIPLKPSGHTPTSSPELSSRVASAVQASVVPPLRASGATTGRVNTRSAPSIRRCRLAGWWSIRASDVISESTGTVPEWLATTSAPPTSGMLSSPRVSTRNHFEYSGRNAASSTCSVRSGSKPKSSTG